MKDRDAIYCRYSSHAQDQGVSIETQLDACRPKASTKPLEFIDRAQSGKTMHRVQFRKMLDAAERGEFSRLLVYKWDRFGRNADTHATIADLEDMGIKVTSVTEGDDFLARSVGLIVAEDYSRKLGERVQASMRVRFKQNKSYMGGVVPYGYELQKGGDGLNRFVINPAEAEVVRAVYHLKLTKSIGMKKIARALDEMGYRPRNGQEWAWSTVLRIMKAEIYTGKLAFGKKSERRDRKTGKIRRVLNPKDMHLIHFDEALRIISDEDFAAVQADIADRVHRDYSLPRDIRVFSGLFWCGSCGSMMYTRHTTLRRTKVYHYLTCSLRDKFGKGECMNNVRPPESELMAWVQDGIRKVLANRDRIVNEALAIAEKSLDTTDARRSRLVKDLAAVEASLKRLGKMMAADLNEAETRGLLGQIGRLEAEKAELGQAMAGIAKEGVVDRKKLISEIKKAMDEANESILNVTDPASVNKIVGKLCGRMIVQPDGTITRKPDAPDPFVDGGPASIAVSRRK